LESSKLVKMEDSLNEAREVFAYFDTKGDERISVTQVGDVLRSLGQNPTNEEIKKCCANWPTPESRITFEDFLPILHTVMKNKEPQSGDKFIEGLSHFDKEGNGFISVAELRHLLTHLGERLTDEEVDQLLQGQEDSDGNVNIADFVRYIMNS
ncbi:Myosin-2 essential light chain, partial [Trichinella britovi]